MPPQLMPALVLSAAALACPASAVAQAQAPAQAPAAEKPAPEPTITLIEAGAEPREPLRFAFQAGQQDHVRIRMEMSTSGTINGAPSPAANIPAFVVPVTSTVTGIEDAGARFEMIIGDIEVAEADSQLGAMFAGAMQDLKGMKVTGLVEHRGLYKDIEVDTGGNTNPMLAGMLNTIRNAVTQTTPPFPEQAIGQGGSWVYELTTDADGLVSTNRTTVKLVRRDGNAFSLQLDITVKADPQQVQGPGMPGQGQAMSTISMEGDGSSSITAMLDHLFPVAMEGETKVQIDRSSEAQGAKMEMSQNVKVKLTLTQANDPEHNEE